ncbi:MAG: hypothetical protein A2V70_15775 [Planctomycetes bacterium RBG_13_63_9]|nr:MAG: hypothetical protein A2V70_15775 [Planctomycetes bacterium RBG_13_63_9]
MFICQDGVSSDTRAGIGHAESGISPTFGPVGHHHEEAVEAAAPSSTPFGRGEEDFPVVLVASDRPAIGRSLRRLLETLRYTVIGVSSGRNVSEHISPKVQVVLLDLPMAEVLERACLRAIRQHFSDVQVIVISRAGEAGDAFAALSEGAFACLAEPWNQRDLLIRLGQAAEVARLARRGRDLGQALCCPMAPLELVGSSGPMRSVRAQIERLAPLDSPVLITGGSGTGKTTAGHLIHRLGPRAARPLIVFHCGVLPRELTAVELFGHVQGAFAGAADDRPGRIEMADRGTLLLDEIGELPLELQPRLLRFLQDHRVERIGSDTAAKVDVRVIGTTSRDLGRMCQQGRFRDDLLAAINELSLRMPTVEECSTDVAELAYEVLRRIARLGDGPPRTLAQAALKILQQYRWPGNVHEMESVLLQAAASADGTTIRAKDLLLNSPDVADPIHETLGNLKLAGMTLSSIERRAVVETLQACAGNRAKAARLLDVSEKTIYNKIKQYKLTGKI